MNVLAVSAVMVLSAVMTCGAEQSWTGKVSDSKCGATHMAGEHGKNMTDRACTDACVKDGAKYVFVSKGKVYQIANQTDPSLVTHAGHTVTLMGEMSGDSITVSKIEMPTKGKGSR